MRKYCMPTLVLLLLFVLPTQVFAQSTDPPYQISELPRPPGSLFPAYVFDLNEGGESVGYLLDNQLIWRALHWDAQLNVTEIGNAGAWSIARTISDNGIIGGINGSTVQTTEPTIWVNGNPTTLNAPAGATDGDVYGVNNSGTAVGFTFSNTASDPLATQWPSGSSNGTQLAPPHSWAFSINNTGEAVGRTDGNGFPDATHWDQSGMTILTGLGGDNDSASGISANGKIAGASFNDATAKFHAIRWDSKNSPPTDLGLYLGQFNTSGRDVNDAGQVVGNYTLHPSFDDRAMLWEPDGTAIDLNDAIAPGTGWVLEQALAINNSGVIVGRGLLNGLERSFILTPNGGPPDPPVCTVYDSQDTPIGLPIGLSSISSLVMVPGDREISDVSVLIDMSHTHVGDLEMVLTHQETNTSVVIMDRPGVPARRTGCRRNDILAIFSDDGDAPVENQCARGSPTIRGTLQPHTPLSAFNGQRDAGVWRLDVIDHRPNRRDGTLNAWSLEICSGGAVGTISAASSNPVIIDDQEAEGGDAESSIAPSNQTHTLFVPLFVSSRP